MATLDLLKAFARLADGAEIHISVSGWAVYLTIFAALALYFWRDQNKTGKTA